MIEQKIDLDDAMLVHYGLKGMKWGIRKGSSTTGVSRARGATIDRNDRSISRITNAFKGKGLMRDRAMMAAGKKLVGDKILNRWKNTRLTEMRNQNARLKSGKATLLDKIYIFQTTGLPSLVISNRPK